MYYVIGVSVPSLHRESTDSLIIQALVYIIYEHTIITSIIVLVESVLLKKAEYCAHVFSHRYLTRTRKQHSTWALFFVRLSYSHVIRAVM